MATFRQVNVNGLADGALENVTGTYHSAEQVVRTARPASIDRAFKSVGIV